MKQINTIVTKTNVNNTGFTKLTDLVAKAKKDLMAGNKVEDEVADGLKAIVLPKYSFNKEFDVKQIVIDYERIIAVVAV